jgi:hypothetical protein
LFDDPVFVVRARAIASHPLKPYDYMLDSDRPDEAAWSPGALPTDTNPPLEAWLLAPFAKAGKGAEAPLHLLMLLVAFLCLGALSGPAAALTGESDRTLLFFALSPTFFLTALTLYAHFFYLLFFAMALACAWRAAAAGSLRAGLGFGLSLVLAALSLHQWPMALLDCLVVFVVVGKGVPGKGRALAAGLALFILAYGGWCLWETKVYGMPHFWGTYRLRSGAKTGYDWPASFVPLTFLAGGVPAVAAAWPLLFRRSRRVFAGLLASADLLFLFFRSPLGGFDGLVSVELSVFLATGAAFLCALPLVWAGSRLLTALFLLEFLFVQRFLTLTAGHHLLTLGFFATALAVRMADAAGIGSVGRRRAAVALAALTLSLAWADLREASISRLVARDFPPPAGKRHHYYWGNTFSGISYYLKEEGWSPYDPRVPMKADDELVVYRNLNAEPVPPFLRREAFTLEKDVEYPGGFGLRTFSVVDEVGWYSASWGVLPWGFSERPLERLQLLKKERNR